MPLKNNIHTVKPQFVKTKDRLPPSESLNDTCNTYYVVRLEQYGLQKAMYIDNGWYLNYFSKIVVPVIEWFDEGGR